MSNVLTIAEAKKKSEGEQVTVKGVLTEIKEITTKQGSRGGTFKNREITISEMDENNRKRFMRVTLSDAYVDRVNDNMKDTEIEVWGTISKFTTDEAIYTSLWKAGIGERIQRSGYQGKTYDPRPAAVNALLQAAAIMMTTEEKGTSLEEGITMLLDSITEKHIDKLLALSKTPEKTEEKKTEPKDDEDLDVFEN